jgi:hypothetical protein
MRIIYSLAKFAVFQSFGITNGKLIIRWSNWCKMLDCDAKWLKNGKLRKPILSAFYNVSQRNFGILLILWCSFKLWWNFCPYLSRSKSFLLWLKTKFKCCFTAIQFNRRSIFSCSPWPYHQHYMFGRPLGTTFKYCCVRTGCIKKR